MNSGRIRKVFFA